MLEQALEYVDPKGNHILFGNLVGKSDLEQAKNYLAELDRKRGIYESEAYQKKQLPYLPSNGGGDKVKAHFDALDGELIFFEVKPSTSGKVVVEHQQTKSFIKKQIKQKLMATKKKAAKKKPVAKKAKEPSLKSFVDEMAWEGKTNAEIFAALDKKKIKYSENSVRWYASKARALDK